MFAAEVRYRAAGDGSLVMRVRPTVKEAVADPKSA
jgi:hypothetical protein